MKDDPCFSCALAECDEKSASCAVRRLNRSYEKKLRRGEKHLVTDAERDAANRLFDSWKLERMALASEGVRPYRRYRTAAAGETQQGAAE